MHTTHDDGITLMAEGRFQEALATLRAAAARGRNSPADLLNMAIAQDRTGEIGPARATMRHLAACMPGWDEPPLRLAESHRAEGDATKAIAMYRTTLARNPNRIEALVALSGLLLTSGEAAEAQQLLVRCLSIAPANHEAWNALGLALSASGPYDQALGAFITAQTIQPDRISYVLNGVDAALLAKQGEQELTRLDSVCQRFPSLAAPLTGLGLLLSRLGHTDRAIDVLDMAHTLASNDLLPLRLLAGVLARSARVVQAEQVLRRLHERTPDDPQVQNDLAAVLMRLHRHAEARSLLLALLQQHGPHVSVLSNLANATTCQGLQEQAVQIARQAIDLDPTSVLARRAWCNALPYQDGTSAMSLLAAMRQCSDVLARTEHPALRNAPDPERKLVVGLLSGTLRTHPVGWLTLAGFENLDRRQFDIVCLTQNSAALDPMARRYHAIASEWIEVDAMTDAELTAAARKAEIDILIDLGGYGDAARMPACADRLAPVQIKWVGSQTHSTGLAEMDWFLTDRWETPAGYDWFYSERLLRLPDGYACYSPPAHAPDVADLPALRNGFVTFGCFNNLAKITPRTIETWTEILRRLPEARLMLKAHQFSDAPTAERVMSAFGDVAGRVSTRGSSGHRALLAEYGDIDIVLDPFPYSGGLTTCEALWMGVPTITCPGEIFASRHSASHMSNVGLADWVVPSLGAYVEAAERRAADIVALAALRAGLRERVRTSPLCDGPRFGRNLGDALRRVWRHWCASA